MNKVFKDHIRKNLAVCIDNMIINFTNHLKHLANLKKISQVMKQNNMIINLDKCAFNVTTRKFLGFMFIKRGTKTIPIKFHIILNMKCSSYIKKVQRLNGWFIVLS